jgi:vanillate/3-O-methylgallate O-demethylase
MSAETLEEWVRTQDDLLETFRAQGQRGSQDPSIYSIPPEQTNWLAEQRALTESCALGDLSHHMTSVHLEGPDVIRFLKRLCVNNFDNFEIGRGKQIVMCNPDGYLIGDGPLLRLDEREFYGAGIHGTKWLQFNLERGEYDLSVDIEPPTPLLSEDKAPEKFVYQIQGPTTADVLEELTADAFRDIEFFGFSKITLAGRDVIAFGHGMSPEAGYELIGPYEYADEIREAIVKAGQRHGLRRLGRKTYVAQSTKVGWVPPWPKPVYESEEMEAYRNWVTPQREQTVGKAYWTDTETLETSFSIEGSFDTDDITEYYLDPVEVGYGKLIDFDHDFIGRDALKKATESRERTLVSLLWDNNDTAEVNSSIFGKHDVYKSLGDLPLVRRATMPYDTVKKDSETVGVSYTRSYQWDIRGVASLCSIDIEYSDPGTEVTVIWGEPDGHSPNPKVEAHVPTKITATVRPAPYKPKQKRQ